jgi:hypothetical protein
MKKSIIIENSDYPEIAQILKCKDNKDKNMVFECIESACGYLQAIGKNGDSFKIIELEDNR